MNTRDPDERLHDARMEIEEMKEQTGHTHCGHCGQWIKDIGGHACEQESAAALAERIGREAHYAGHMMPMFDRREAAALIEADRAATRKAALEDACRLSESEIMGREVLPDFQESDFDGGVRCGIDEYKASIRALMEGTNDE